MRVDEFTNRRFEITHSAIRATPQLSVHGLRKPALRHVLATVLIPFGLGGLGRAGTPPFHVGVSPLGLHQIGESASRLQPTYRVEINYVEITVRAVNTRGEFVSDLKEADFRVFEDGRPQTISTFKLVTTGPGNGGAGASGAPALNGPADLPASGGRPGDRQVYLFVLDDLHVRPGYSTNARRVGWRFLDAHMSPGDMAGVVFTSGAPGQDLTTDKGALRKAFDRMTGELEGPGIAVSPLISLSDALRASKVLADLSAWLATIPGRHKALVYVSTTLGCNVGYVGASGNDTPDRAVLESEVVGTCREAVFEAVDAATRGNVSIYSIDPQGMSFGSAQNEWSGGGLGRSPVQRVRRMHGPTPIHGVRAVAEMTGGFFELGATRLDRFLGRVVRENSAYYVIGYYSSNANSAAKRTVHKNEIKIALRGVTALYRRQYAVTPSSKEGF